MSVAGEETCDRLTIRPLLFGRLCVGVPGNDKPASIRLLALIVAGPAGAACRATGSGLAQKLSAAAPAARKPMIEQQNFDTPGRPARLGSGRRHPPPRRAGDAAGRR